MKLQLSPAFLSVESNSHHLLSIDPKQRNYCNRSTGNIKIHTDKALKTIFAVGPSGSSEHFWTLFNALTLAFLTCFQVTVCCFVFFRLTQAISSRGRIESSHGAKAQLTKGIGWISGSLMLGGIETVIGLQLIGLEWY